MINKEKAAAFEGSLSTDGLALVGGYAGEGGMGDGVGNDVVNGAAVASAQQEKAIQEMDLAIAEKEEILTKLLDTVRGRTHTHALVSNDMIYPQTSPLEYSLVYILTHPVTHSLTLPPNHIPSNHPPFNPPHPLSQVKGRDLAQPQWNA